MIVQDPPYDLIALFADLEMQKFLETLVERGQEPRRGCLAPFRWRPLRDPRRDPVWRDPVRDLGPYLGTEARFLIAWDHHGSGEEGRPAAEVERQVVDRFERAGVSPERVLVVAFAPEVERLFGGVWPRIKELLAALRQIEPPDDEAVLRRMRARFGRPVRAENLAAAFEHNPKELFEALALEIRLRRAAPLYSQIGEAVSLRGLKRDATAERIAARLVAWFPVARSPHPL